MEEEYVKLQSTSNKTEDEKQIEEKAIIDLLRGNPIT